MIQEFSVQNFLSFQKKQTISFLATPDKTLSEILTVEMKPGVRLLRMAMIYGANASGKSNLLIAIETLWRLLFSPQTEEHKKIGRYKPFATCKGKPTEMGIVFWANNRRYQYVIRYDEKMVLYEEMQYTSDKDVLSLMYKREEGKDIKFGSTLNIKAKDQDKLNDNTLGNHTVLSTFNKINIDIPLLKELYEWIKCKVHELGVFNDGEEIAKQAESNPEIKKIMVELLNKADFNIADFNLIDISIPDTIVHKIEKDIELSEELKERFKHPTELIFLHKTKTQKFSISWGFESAGTKVYFRLARLLFDLKNSNCVFMEDELEESLHYDLLVHYLQTYLQLAGKSQLIFTTHNQMLLDEDWMVRRDMICFVEKDEASGSSNLYRASDMGLHKNISLLNAYKIGKLGAKPLLGSTLLKNL